MKINKVHLLFEQSGTFKNEFIKLGINAEDYDLRDDFNQTDHVVDLFVEIEKCYNNIESIFDNIEQSDLIFAFFPCTMFNQNNRTLFKCQANQFKGYSNTEKLEYVIKREETRAYYYNVLCRFIIIAKRKNIRLIIENPYTQPHYLTEYFPIEPSLIDKDRKQRGDYYKKPTQYFFVNCEPEHNFVNEAIAINKVPGSINEAHLNTDFFNCNIQVARSMISPDYARRFIKEFILDSEV